MKQNLNSIVVAREVYRCGSQIVEFILNTYDSKGDKESKPFTWDDVENLYYTYVEAKRNNIIVDDVSEEDYDPEQKEILEYWFCSGYFTEQLGKLNEPVITEEGIWCRTTSGQSIAIDGVIYELVERFWDEGFYFDERCLSDDYFEVEA
jgi:hypothetical protein